MKEIEGRTLRKVCVRLSLSGTSTGIDYFENLPVTELVDVIDVINEVNK